MARLARLVIPGLPYHVTQRGNRRGDGHPIGICKYWRKRRLRYSGSMGGGMPVTNWRINWIIFGVGAAILAYLTQPAWPQRLWMFAI